MNWGVEDFAAAVVLLTTTALAVVTAVRFVQPMWRWILVVGIIAVAVAIWAHLAVGIW